MKKQVLIIGAGASGLTSAIYAARAGAQVTLLEHKERAGKKILSTGNGRCNLTNLDQKEDYYRCSQTGFPGRILGEFTAEHTLDFFENLGILPKNRNGYIYPNSDQAASVLEALLQEIETLKVKIIYQCHISKAEKRGEKFLIASEQGEFWGDALILATGSKAAPITGSDGSGYELAAALGHRILTPLPALVQLRCRESHYKELAGIRAEAGLRLFADERFLAGDMGELQLTDYGISGIPTFQISRYASIALHRKQTVKVTINYLPHMSRKEAVEFLERRRRKMGEKTFEQWMNGLLNQKLSLVLLKLSGIPRDQRVKRVSDVQWEGLIKQITSYETVVKAANSFENAQVCCGGIDTKEVHEDTLESKLVKGLYFCGEILDVDGKCGGYNLQWAWSSGAVAGRCAALGRDTSIDGQKAGQPYHRRRKGKT